MIDLSKTIDEGIIEVCQAVSTVADVLGFSFYIVGATARDIILHGAYGIEPLRATRDIDFGIKVSTMRDFVSLMILIISFLTDFVLMSLGDMLYQLSLLV